MIDLLTRYEQAQALEQGVLSRQVVLNDTVLPHWVENSDCFWYQRETVEGISWRLVNAKAASNEPAFDPIELANALGKAADQSVDPANLPICVMNIDLDSQYLLPHHVHFKAFDKCWQFEVQSRTCQVVKKVNTEPDSSTSLVSPDGQKTAFVCDHNIWVRNAGSDKKRALTETGCAENAFATAPAIFGAPITPAVQAIWSPDSRYLLTHQLDVRQLATRSLVQHVPQDNTLRPQLTEYVAAFPDDERVESYRLLIIDTLTGEQKTVNDSPISLCRLGNGYFSEEKLGWWANDSRRVYFVDVARGATSIKIVEFDWQAEATRVLLEENSDTNLKLSHSIMADEPPLFMPLPDTEELIWFSERSGWGHLYLYDLATGELKYPLTEGEWLVRGILDLDTSRRELLIQTAGRDAAINPYYKDICRLHLDTGVLTPIAGGPYEYRVFEPSSQLPALRAMFGLDTSGVSGLSPSGNYLVTTRSRVDRVPVSILLDRDGNEVLTLEKADPVGLPPEWHWPEPVNLIAADGETALYGSIFFPPGFAPDKGYPVLDFFSCGHPGFSFSQHSSFANGPLYGMPYFRAAAFAALGFIVVMIEGRGTPYRHKAFHDHSFGDMVAANAFDDHVAGLQQLAVQRPYMDLDRVGIVAGDGLSAPVYGLLQHPDFYKVGVAIAFQDRRFAPACLIDSFEGVAPQEKILQTKTPCPEMLATSLQGKLLLIHGLLDTVAAPAGIFRLIEALQRANKNVDLLLLPNLGHDIPSYVLRRTWDYLVTHLQGVEPPKEFKLTKGIDLLMQGG